MSPSNLKSNINHTTKNTEVYEQKNLNGRQSITFSGHNEDELRQRIEEEASANNLNFNFSRGRATVFNNSNNPEPFYTRSDSLGTTNVGFRYPDTAKSQHSGSKP